MPKRDRTIFEPQTPMWKTRDIIQGLGGVSGLTEKLMELGFYPPNADTVQGWSTRNRIPGSWTPAVYHLAMREGLIKDPMDALINYKRLHPLDAA